MSEKKRVVITGMSVNTPIGDTLETFLENLLRGRSAITRWKTPGPPGVLSKIGGDLSGYDISAKALSLRDRVPPSVARKSEKLLGNSSWVTNLTLLLAIDAFRDAGLFNAVLDAGRISAIIAAHNINEMYMHRNWSRFAEDPDTIDPMLALRGYDCDHAGVVADILGIHGPIFTVGGACASGVIGLRSAMDEICYHNSDIAVVVGPVYDFSPVVLHSFAMVGALSVTKFNDEPEKASRPFDRAREGFVPSHGGGVLIAEEMEHAVNRAARIYGEICGVAVNSSATWSPHPSEDDQARVIDEVLRGTGTDPGEIDFISGHATSTILGDLAEVRAIKRVFGDHAREVRINAPKSIFGHTLFSSAVVETIAAVLQMNAGWLHPSINIDELDPEIDLNICANRAVEHRVGCLLKNSFGFSGINSALIIRRFSEHP